MIHIGGPRVVVAEIMRRHCSDAFHPYIIKNRMFESKKKQKLRTASSLKKHNTREHSDGNGYPFTIDQVRRSIRALERATKLGILT